MKRRLILASIAILTCASASSAQEGDEMTKLTAAVTALTAKVDQFVTKDELTKEIKMLTELLREREAEIKDLQTTAVSQRDAAAELSKAYTELKSVLEQISYRDQKNQHVINVRGLMASDEGRRDMAGAVQDAMPKFGTVIVNNRMSAGYWIKVGGERYYVAPGATIHVENIPVGTLVTELEGYESAKHWTLAAPTYSQTINITPQVAAPLMVEPLVYWP